MKNVRRTLLCTWTRPRQYQLSIVLVGIAEDLVDIVHTENMHAWQYAYDWQGLFDSFLSLLQKFYRDIEPSEGNATMVVQQCLSVTLVLKLEFVSLMIKRTTYIVQHIA